jgi:hypothetical protein
MAHSADATVVLVALREGGSGGGRERGRAKKDR